MTRNRTAWGTWAISLLGGSLVLLAVAALFRAPPTPVAPPMAHAKPGSPVEMKQVGERLGDRVFGEETTLRDPTPLFLPTRWNAGEDALPIDLQREPGSSFLAYSPQLLFPESNLILDLPPAVQVPDSAVDALVADKARRPFGGFGQIDQAPAPLPSRGAFVRILSASDGELMVSQPLLNASPPGETAWQPLEFLVAVDPSGVVRPPVLIDSSRVASVDAYFETFMIQALRIGERLQPGFYRVCIGP